jgi:hypothetical protein
MFSIGFDSLKWYNRSLLTVNALQPKIPPTCLEVIKEGIIAFGARCFPIKDIIKSLEPVLNGTNGW